MTILNESNEVKLDQVESERLAQDFKVPPHVEQKIQNLSKELYDLCTEHEVPALLHFVLSKETEDEDIALVVITAGALPGRRAPEYLKLANKILRGKVSDLGSVMEAVLTD